MKTILTFSFLVVFFTFTANTQSVGETAPDFSLTDLQGNTVSLSQHNGKVVALFIFGSSCPSCIAVGPSVESNIQAVYGSNSNFVLLGLDQWNGTAAAVESFKVKTGASFTLLQKASAMASAYKSTYDRIIIVDQQGKIAFKGTKLVSSDLNAAVSTISSLLLTASITKTTADQTIEIYPNPVSSNLNLKLNSDSNETLNLSLRGIDGKTILTYTNQIFRGNQNSYSIDMEGVSPGIYFAVVSIGSKTQVVRVVKQ